jgi:hypothetical protein
MKLQTLVCRLVLLIAACAVEVACGSGTSDGTTGPASTAGTSNGEGGAGLTSSAGSGGAIASGGTSGSMTSSSGAGGSTMSSAGGGAATSGGGASGAGGASSGGTGGVSTDTPFAVVTNRYDNERTGANTHETILNKTNVAAAGKFGLLFSRMYDGNPYAQPLYVAGLTIAGAKHNVVFVASSTNDVYAFDADDPSAMTPYWHKQVASPATVTVGGSPGAVNPVGTTWCQDMYPFSGITGTPVIDLATNRMYLVSQEGNPQNTPAYGLKLHALDLATGNEVSGGPVVIDATVDGTGGGSSNGKVKLDAWRQFNRAGLTLFKGVLYVGLTSHCDENPYHGWLFAYDPGTLAQKSVFNTTPNGSGAAIWQSGNGIAANDNGLFFSTSNGSHSNDGKALGVSVVRMGLDNTIGDWFTPSNADALNGSDQDLTAGVLLIPGTNYMVSAGKEGVAYLIDQTNMTHFNSTDKIPQKVKVAGGEIHDFVFYNNNLYAWPDGNPLSMYPFANGKLNDGAVQKFDGYTPGHPGGVMTISANGAADPNAILWATVISLGDAWHNIAKGALLALDASNPSTVLFDSTNGGTAAGNTLGNLAKFSPPTVANGKVYVTTFADVKATSPSYLRVYGLKN